MNEADDIATYAISGTRHSLTAEPVFYARDRIQSLAKFGAVSLTKRTSRNVKLYFFTFFL
jgi:hypothetical protein